MPIGNFSLLEQADEDNVFFVEYYVNVWILEPVRRSGLDVDPDQFINIL